MSEEIRIYVACLAAYNNGYLHGVWIDATRGVDDIQEQISNMLESSPIEDAEEYAIHDFEGYRSYRLSEYQGIESAHEIAHFIEEHGGVAAGLMSYFSTLDEARMALEENYAGGYESVTHFAEELTTDTTEIPESLSLYIDYERMGHDLELGGDIFTIEIGYREVHIFWNH